MVCMFVSRHAWHARWNVVHHCTTFRQIMFSSLTDYTGICRPQILDIYLYATWSISFVCILNFVLGSSLMMINPHFAATLACPTEGLLVTTPNVRGHEQGPPLEQSYVVTSAEIVSVPLVAKLVVLSAGWSTYGRDKATTMMMVSSAFLTAGRYIYPWGRWTCKFNLHRENDLFSLLGPPHSSPPTSSGLGCVCVGDLLHTLSSTRAINDS